MTITVIKLGGSLMNSDELSEWLNCIVTFAETSNIIIVPGGGEFADSVRRLQKVHKFDDYAAHQMALMAMSQYGYFLSGINSKLQIVKDKNSISSALGKSLPLMWLPFALIGDDSAIPASWNFTSDSIALWLAMELHADRLILVKSVDLNSTGLSLHEHISNGHLDKGFQLYSDDYSGEIYFMDKSQYSYLTNSSAFFKERFQPITA